MYYPDLTPYCYIEHKRALNVLNVGWLDIQYPFLRKKASEELLDTLFERCLHFVNRTRGYQECQFRPVPTFGVEVFRHGASTTLGSAEIWVETTDGKIYAAPNLIYHCVVEHDYDPPTEFVEALLR